MSQTPIYDQLKAEQERAAISERAPWLDQSCEACLLMYKGWGGQGCCDVCDQISAEHTCAPEDRP